MGVPERVETVFGDGLAEISVNLSIDYLDAAMDKMPKTGLSLFCLWPEKPNFCSENNHFISILLMILLKSDKTRSHRHIHLEPMVMAVVTPEIISKKIHDERPSRSEKKRRMERLQELGQRIVELPAGKLARLELPEELLDAVKEARKLTSMGATRRQIQYIGRIIEDFDTARIANDLRDIDLNLPKRAPKGLDS
jgi:hypothetical protein